MNIPACRGLQENKQINKQTLSLLWKKSWFYTGKMIFWVKESATVLEYTEMCCYTVSLWLEGDRDSVTLKIKTIIPVCRRERWKEMNLTHGKREVWRTSRGGRWGGFQIETIFPHEAVQIDYLNENCQDTEKIISWGVWLKRRNSNYFNP